LTAIADVAEGREPRGVVRDPKSNRFPELVVLSEVVSAETDCRAYMRKAAAENRPAAGSGK
jgi:hypothetical protein